MKKRYNPEKEKKHSKKQAIRTLRDAAHALMEERLDEVFVIDELAYNFYS
jgi:hypothetical protein